MCETIKTEEMSEKKVYSHIYNETYERESKKHNNISRSSQGEYEMPIKSQ